MRFRCLIVIALLIGLCPAQVFSEEQNNNLIACGMTKDAIDKMFPDSEGIHQFSFPFGRDQKMYHCYSHYIHKYKRDFYFIYEEDSLYSIIESWRIWNEVIQSGSDKGSTRGVKDNYDPVKFAKKAILVTPYNINDFQKYIDASPRYASSNKDWGLTFVYYTLKFILYPVSLMNPDQSEKEREQYLKEHEQYLKNFLFDKNWLEMDYSVITKKIGNPFRTIKTNDYELHVFAPADSFYYEEDRNYPVFIIDREKYFHAFILEDKTVRAVFSGGFFHKLSPLNKSLQPTAYSGG